MSSLSKALLTTAAAAIAFTVWSPAGPLALLGGFVLVALMATATVRGIRDYRPRRELGSHLAHPEPWLLLVGSALGFAVALIIDHPGGGLPTTGASMVALLIQVGAMAATGIGLLDMMRQRFGDRCGDYVREALIGGGTSAMIVWIAILEPSLQHNNLALSHGILPAVVITASCILTSMGFALAQPHKIQLPSFTAMAAAQMAFSVATVAGYVSSFGENPGMVRMACVLPLLSFALLGVGAADPTMAMYDEPSEPAGARLSRGRLATLIVPVILGPAMLTLGLIGALSLSPVATTLYTIALSVLVVLHLIIMVQARASSTHWASHDKLTGLPNRALFRERTAQALDRARKLGHSVAVMYLDLDRFKHVNDSMGHEAGDQLLEQVAKRILTSVDSNDTVARLGGDEFAILLPQIDDERIPRQLARRLLKSFSTPYNLKPRPIFMSPSLGIAVSVAGDVSLETLLTQADTAMYRAKESGRNNFAVWSQEMNEASKQRLMLETHLHSAIANDELRLLYQPKVELSSGRIVGVEALIRWHHPKLGVISPSVFIHLAEESGLINQIGEWVLYTACTQGRVWQENGFENLSVAVNLSSLQFQQQNIADLVSHVLRQTGLPPHRLELELTESIAMSGDDGTLSTLRDLRGMGVRTSIDDFGTGYSNLSYLSKFPIDSLKIDKSFIEQIDDSEGNAAIVVAIIAMAHGLGLNVIAEGVETVEQAEFLTHHDCDEMQGYLFSKPITPGELEGLLMLENVANGPGRLQSTTHPGGAQRRIERPMPDRERVTSTPPPTERRPVPVVAAQQAVAQQLVAQQASTHQLPAARQPADNLATSRRKPIMGTSPSASVPPPATGYLTPAAPVAATRSTSDVPAMAPTSPEESRRRPSHFRDEE